MTATMRVLRAHRLIGPPGLWVDEIPVPARPERNSAVLGVNWAGLVDAEPSLFRAAAAQLDGLIAAGMTPLPSTTYDLADAEAAFTAIEQRDIVGKTVLLVRHPGPVAT